ncbi:hypothetical protein FB451DRAFT_1176331 [Mycena latifolia]|nr:hypothetical protein FB451DRAFT_1176331 [Mycena latifolia]
MKRGFLNRPPKAKACTNPPPPPSEPDASAAGRESSTPNSDSEPPESKPEQQEGNEPPLDPHRPPQWLIDQNKSGQTRFIFRSWPRDPAGQEAPEMEPGKTTPNGIVYWGATLYDFYYFQAIPTIPNYIMTSTGSRLAATMRKIGELDAAAPEIEWADREEEPRQLVLPQEIAHDIRPMENRIAWNASPFSLAGATCLFVRGTEHAHAAEVPLPESDPDEHCDIASITPENYPRPWPIVPFSFVKPPLPKLETLIPYTLLPKKLIVHDPWNLLSMPDELEPDAMDKDWTHMTDIARTYDLKPLTKAGLHKSDHQHEVFRGRVDDLDYSIPPFNSPDGGGRCSPMLRIKVPPYPHKKTTPAAHLYISPASKAGVGNHSAVYDAEWELPRSLLVPDVFCRECVAQELEEMRASGELDRIIAEATGNEPWGHITEKIEVIPEGAVDVSKPGHKDENTKPDIRIAQPRTIERTRTYDGPIVDIHPKARWQTPGRGENCAHVRRGNEGARPPTATVRVCAKLSIQDDRHLAREAKVYQALPAHLSEHWSGYNLVRPSRAPVPVGAVVPQFYGYYVPAPESTAGSGYLSPIMLLENCGAPLDPEVLSADEKTECWSLLYRLHHADWVHESVAARNIVTQRGPLTVPQGWMRGWPSDRNPVSFRVIDFGRSLYCGPKVSEEDEDVYRDLRAPERSAEEKIRRERVDVDRLLSQGMFH